MGDADDVPDRAEPVESRKSRWIRARRSGIALLDAELGDRGDELGVVHDAVGTRLSRITSSTDGIVIGHIQHPLVNQGDAIVHVAEVIDP